VTDRRLLLDDHLLLRVLLDDEPPSLRPDGAQLFTTGLWYHRLGRALSGPTMAGALSRRLGNLDVRTAGKAVEAIASLPETIGLVSLRGLAWPMASLLADGARLNLLSLEALAAAMHLDATICLAAEDVNPTLAEAAAERGVALRVVA
jgi:hypothetical protein